MANIRVPKVAEKLLPFCKPWANPLPNACFRTYADLIMFAAGFGFQQLRGQPVHRCSTFIENEQPYPIDFSVLKNPGQQLYPLVLLLGLAAEKSHEIVRDDERLAKTIENYASVGCEMLVTKLATTTSEEFHVELAQLLLDAAA